MKPLKLFPALILVIGLSGCPSTDISRSEFVKQSEICQTYSIVSDEESNMLDVTTFFRFGGSKGTTLVLNDSAGSLVKMGERPLNLVQNSMGAQYTLSEPFAPGKKTFTFIDGDGKSYHNTISCEEFKVYNVPSVIERSKVLELNFIGMAPEQTEQLICEYKDTAMAFSSDYTITDVKNNKIFIPLSVFQKMKNGPVTLRFYRRNYIVTQSHGSLPGYLRYEYKGVKFKCTLSGKGNEFVKNEI